MPVSSDQWVVTSLLAGANAAGGWQGAAVIRNDSPNARDGDFIVTLIRAKREIAKFTGSALQVPGGGTTTVVLKSTDRFSSGAYTYALKTTFGF